MSELQRLKGLLPPEMQSWVFVESAAAVEPPLITLEEIGRDEVEIQVDLDQWDQLALDHRNLLFWHEVGRIQNDTIPRDGWEMAALAIGLGGAIGELWVQDGLLLLMALGFAGAYACGWRGPVRAPCKYLRTLYIFFHSGVLGPARRGAVRASPMQSEDLLGPVQKGAP